MEQLLATEKYVGTELTPTQLPISELFCSVQGEGVFCGQRQYFIRTAGCTVGKPYLKSEGFPIHTERCVFANDTEFPCDTDFRVKGRFTVPELLDRVSEFPGVKDVCITGGEPLMHQRRLVGLLRELKARGYMIHCETSGTIQIEEHSDIFWVTVSPKKGILPGMLQRANEFKILVDRHFHPDSFPFDLVKWSMMRPTFLQPINKEHEVDVDNLRLCLQWQERYPSFRLSLQLHKVLEKYLSERIL